MGQVYHRGDALFLAKPLDSSAALRWSDGVTSRFHDDELRLDEGLVRALLYSLSTSYDDLPLRRLEASGSSNALYRLGDDLLVRLPRQPGGTATIEKEQRWLPFVSPAVAVAVPEILAVGDPGSRYSERWSVVRWLDGETPGLPGLDEAPRHGLARDLGAVVRGLRGVDVPEDALGDRALRWYRGDPLAAMDDDVRRLLRECREIDALRLDLDACAALWEDAVSLPGACGVLADPRWYHGDLLAENLLVRGDRLAAVLDFGGLSVGDPTVDLVVAWELLDPAARSTFREEVGVEDETWLRGRAWALALALMTFPYYWATMPERCLFRLAMVHAVLADH